VLCITSGHLHLQIDGMYTLYCDNQSAIALSADPINHAGTQHIDIRFHFLRDEVNKNRLILNYVPSEKNLADVFTKPCTRVKLQEFFTLIFGVGLYT
jgi:hypothetical protein